MDGEDDDVLVALIVALSAFMYVARVHFGNLKRRKRRWWVRPLNRSRSTTGFHLTLFRELKSTDHEEFFSYTRMRPDQFQELLHRVHPRLPKGGIRRPLSSELKLALTLACLAHGDSVRSKAWEFRVGKSTVRKVIREVCRCIWEALQPEYLPSPSRETWEKVINGFFTKWQFPNCLGAVDGKHVKIKAPPRSGSKYFCYKQFFSIVLLAICDADYRFVWVDIGQYGSVSDGGVWANTDLARNLDSRELDFPPPRALPQTTVRTNHAFVADEAFPLSEHMLRPYSRRLIMNDSQRVFNYRLSRARRTIENAFGIMAARWQILLRGLSCGPETGEDILKALVCLHNFVMHGEDRLQPNERRYCAPGLIDTENVENGLMEGEWRGLVGDSQLFRNISRLKGNSGSDVAKAQRDVLCSYFISPAGYQQAPWQFDMACRGRQINMP